MNAAIQSLCTHLIVTLFDNNCPTSGLWAPEAAFPAATVGVVPPMQPPSEGRSRDHALYWRAACEDGHEGLSLKLY